MLVLSRKAGERILIGDDVAISIVRIGPNTVKIGIEAPKSVSIVREELCETEPEMLASVKPSTASLPQADQTRPRNPK